MIRIMEAISNLIFTFFIFDKISKRSWHGELFSSTIPILKKRYVRSNWSFLISYRHTHHTFLTKYVKPCTNVGKIDEGMFFFSQNAEHIIIINLIFKNNKINGCTSVKFEECIWRQLIIVVSSTKVTGLLIYSIDWLVVVASLTSSWKYLMHVENENTFSNSWKTWVHWE